MHTEFLVLLLVLAAGDLATGLPADRRPDVTGREPAFDKISKVNRKVMFEKHVFEGDIRVTDDELEALQSDVSDGHHKLNDVKFLNRQRRSSLLDENKKWPGARVPYDFDPALNSKARDAVVQASAELARQTCVRLEPKTSADFNYVYFADYGGCWSYIGRTGQGPQAVSIGQGCEWKQVVLHEVLHALGYFHEQSRIDRDNFVTVLYGNILPGMESNFAIHSATVGSAFGFPYNKQGIMHYSNYAFSGNSQKTIISNMDSNEVLGGAMGLTQTDVDKINAYYGCSSITTTTTPGTTTTTTTPPPTTTTTTRPPTTTSTTQPPTSTTTTPPPITTTTTPPPTSTTTSRPPATTTTTPPPTTTTTTPPPTTTSTTRPPTATTTTPPPTTTTSTPPPTTTSTTRPPTAITTTPPPTTTNTTPPPTTTTTTPPPTTISTTRPPTATTTTPPPTTTTSTPVPTSTTTTSPPTTKTTQPPAATTTAPPTATPSKATCTQLDAVGFEWHCAKYATAGYCGISSWMSLNCQRTCCLKGF